MAEIIMIGRNGDVADYEFEYISEFCEGVATVRRDIGGYGAINTNGRLIIPCIFDKVYTCQEGMVNVRLNHAFGAFNAEGKEILSPEYNYISDWRNGFAIVVKLGYYGVSDKYGELVIDTKYDHITPFSSGFLCRKGEDNILLNPVK